MYRCTLQDKPRRHEEPINPLADLQRQPKKGWQCCSIVRRDIATRNALLLAHPRIPAGTVADYPNPEVAPPPASLCHKDGGLETGNKNQKREEK
jgi:hypothetical protein